MTTTGEVLGTKNKNLILETAGKLYIKVNDRYYDIDFRNLDSGRLVGTKVQTVQEKVVQEPVEELDLSEYITSAALKKELKKYVTERSFQDVMETQEALQDAKLQGFTEAITPITIQTMSIAVGQDQLQFDIVQDLTSTIPGKSPLYIDNDESSDSFGSLMFKPCCIKHYTLDGPTSVSPDTSNSEYWRWYILNTNQENSIETLSLDSTTYYVYMVIPHKQLSGGKESSSGVKGSAPYFYLTESGVETTETIGANIYKNGEGNIVESPNASGIYYKTGVGYLKVSEEAIGYDEYIDEGYYHLLYAIITNADGDPSWTTMNGFTEITPGQIRAYLFSNADGSSFLNLQNSEFQLARKIKNENGEEVTDVALHYDPDKGLTLKGKITILGDSGFEDSSGNIQSLDNKFNQVLDKISNVQNQVDGAIETWYEDGPPSANTFPTNDWQDNKTKENHVGDIYYDKKDGKAYRYMGSGSESNREYVWIQIVDTDINKALEEASNALSVADRKSKTWLAQPAPPYSSGDTWITDKEYLNDDKSVKYKKGELLVCTISIPEKTDGVANTFSWDNWTLATHYTSEEDLQTFRTEYQGIIDNLNIKIDGKVETWASESDPSSSWNTDKKSHIGDIWINTSSIEISNVKPGQSAVWNGTEWEIVQISSAILDYVDGKRDIFFTSGADWNTPPTPPYKVGDVWISQAPEPTDNSEKGYSETYVCITAKDAEATGSTDDWAPASDAKSYIDSKYTELSSKFGEYEYLKEAIGSSSTIIDGGLVLSSLIGLGTWTKGDDGSFKLDQVMSGINGQIGNQGERSIAAWYGGSMIDREIRGLSQEDYNKSAKTLFRHDGSGYLASGNISFSPDGTLNFGKPDKNNIYNLSINSDGVVSIGGNMKITGSDTDINNLLDRLTEIESNVNSWFTFKDNILTTRYHLVSNLGFSSAVASSASGGGGGLLFDGDYDKDWDANLYASHSMSARLGKIMWDAIKNKVSTPAEIFGSSAIGDSTTFMYWDGSALKTSKLGNLAFSNATIPTSTSDLTNNSGFVTEDSIANKYVERAGGTMLGSLLIEGNLEVRGITTLDPIKVGNCTITYDSSNECLKFTF